MEDEIYREMLRINRGFAAALRGLDAFRGHEEFHSSELRRFRDLIRETRASLNSYLTGVIESAETDEAGRLFRKRLRREQAEEEKPGPV